MPQLKKILDAKLNEYNESNAKMDLVLFNQAMEHICRISRIIDTPRGNALLVGVGGSGKQSLTRLAAYIGGHFAFQLALTKTYNMNSLMDDFRTLYKLAGQQNKRACFLFTEAEIKVLSQGSATLKSGKV